MWGFLSLCGFLSLSLPPLHLKLLLPLSCWLLICYSLDEFIILPGHIQDWSRDCISFLSPSHALRVLLYMRHRSSASLCSLYLTCVHIISLTTYDTLNPLPQNSYPPPSIYISVISTHFHVSPVFLYSTVPGILSSDLLLDP